MKKALELLAYCLGWLALGFLLGTLVLWGIFSPPPD
jgi:hypothetical protein